MNHPEKDRNVFSRPLIIGASISAGYGTRDGGPGAVFARLINPEAKITNLAYNGATSVASTAALDVSAHSPTVLLGLDLFFWDAVLGQTGSRFEASTKKFFDQLRDRDLPAILGKVPVFDFPFGIRAEVIGQHVRKVNALLEEHAERAKKVLLYDPLSCLLKMDGSDHFSDGLHLTRKGNEFCAQFLLEDGGYRKLSGVQELDVA